MMEDIEIEKYYYPNGKIYSEVYFLNGKRHNKNGPAHIWYYPDGNIKSKFYWLNGKFHNENGPAIRRYNKNGKIEIEYYYLNGNEITDELQIMVMKGLKQNG